MYTQQRVRCYVNEKGEKDQVVNILRYSYDSDPSVNVVVCRVCDCVDDQLRGKQRDSEVDVCKIECNRSV